MGSVALEGFGSGGAALNFKVVPGLTQPVTASENTIWVMTEEISGWLIDANQPENLTEGMVWIAGGNLGVTKFNALRKNGIEVYPKYVTQYVNGTLVDVPAMIYQNGVWENLSAEFVIFESGKGALVPLNKYKESDSDIVIDTESIEVTYTSTETNYVSALRTGDKINLSEYSALYMRCIPSKRINSSYASLGVTSTAFTKADPTTNAWVAKTAISASSTEKTIMVDLSAVNESLYVAFQFGGKMSVTKLWLRR